MLKVFILCPERRLIVLSRGVDEAVSKWQLETCSGHNQLNIQLYNRPGLHNACDLESLVLTSVPKHLLKHFVKSDNRDDKIGCILNRWRKERCPLGVDEVF